jgi:hypothetical protein
MRTRHIAVFLALALSGCYSFNTIQLPAKGDDYKVSPAMLKGIIADNAIKNKQTKEVQDITPPMSVKVDKKEPVVAEKATISCQAYIMPSLPKTPELPTKELMKANPDDWAALDKIQTQHIIELREYIAKLKVDLRNSHNDYLTKCTGDKE